MVETARETMKECKCKIWPNGCSCGVAAWEKKIARLAERVRVRRFKERKARLICADHEQYPRWKCCDTHKALAVDYNSHLKEATSLHVDPDAMTLSPNWWKAVGRQDMSNRLLEDRWER
jgi:hypothetical protein